MAAHLAVGQHSLVAYRSAAQLWGLEVAPAHRPQLLVPRGHRVRRPGLDVHVTTTLIPADRIVVDGISVTSAVRTIIDLAAVLAIDEVEELIDDALRQHLFRIRRLEWRHSLMGQPGRLGPLIAERLGRAVPDRRLGTRFLRILRDARMSPPVPEYPVVLPDGRSFRLDFAYPDLSVYVELDGSRREQLARLRKDMRRQNALSALGWRPLRFVTDDLRHRAADICAEVAQATRPSRW